MELFGRSSLIFMRKINLKDVGEIFSVLIIFMRPEPISFFVIVGLRWPVVFHVIKKDFVVDVVQIEVSI